MQILARIKGGAGRGLPRRILTLALAAALLAGGGFGAVRLLGNRGGGEQIVTDLVTRDTIQSTVKGTGVAAARESVSLNPPVSAAVLAPPCQGGGQGGEGGRSSMSWTPPRRKRRLRRQRRAWRMEKKAHQCCGAASGRAEAACRGGEGVPETAGLPIRPDGDRSLRRKAGGSGLPSA